MVLNKYLSMIITSVLMLTLLISCGTEPEDNGENEINPNIVKMKDCCSQPRVFFGDVSFGNQKNDKIYYIGGGFGHLQLDEFYVVKNDSVFPPETYVNQLQGVQITYMSEIAYRNNFLTVVSNFGGVSIGRLYKYDLVSNNFSLLRDSTYNISSAVYWHGDDSKLVYYSYGNDDGLEAGYYLHNRVADTDSLLLAHRSPMGPSEMLNGFDLSPDNRKLLIPDVRATPSEVLSPQIVEYDLHTQQADTFDVAFDLSFVRIGLWLRYSPDGTQILYSNFPFGSYTETTNDDSEVGIIEVDTRQKRVLDVNTNARGSRRSVQLAPTWSPDGQHIIYGSGPLVMPDGIKGTYSLYLLKNVDDPRNFK
jgi:hypothetical protein